MYGIFVLFLFVSSLPIQAVIALVIAITSGLPAIYAQKRVGKHGKPFEMYKFRTMFRGAEKLQQHYADMNEADGPVFKIRDDPRFTRIGRFLAHTGLDELPQLWNVVRGDMALFGPRPLPVAEAKELKPWQKARAKIKPGIISPWILEGYHHVSFRQWMKSDIAYVKKKSPSYDLRLVLRTAKFLLGLVLSEIGFHFGR